MKGPRHLNFIRAAQSRSVSLCLFFLVSSLRNTYFPAEIVFPFISQNMTNLIYQEQIVPSKVVFLINSGLVKFLSDRKHSKWFKLWRSGLNSLILLLSFYVTLGKMLYFFKPRSPMWKRRIAALSQFMPVLRIQQCWLVERCVCSPVGRYLQKYLKETANPWVRPNKARNMHYLWATHWRYP